MRATRVLLGSAVLTVLSPALASATAGPAPQGTTITVTGSIQAAVDQARPGDTVVVPAGVYRETVLVSIDDLTIRAARGAVLDGTGNASRIGLRVRPADGDRINGFTMSGMRVQNWAGVGVLASGVDHFRLTGGVYADNGVYGVFPIRCTDGRIDHNVVSGSLDSGVYVGQCDDVLVDANLAYRNTVGIEVEASTRITVRGNVATGNAVGGLVQLLPLLSVKVTEDVTVTRNVFSGNTAANPVTDATEPLSGLPGGVGLVNVAGDRVVITDNVVVGNPTGGIGVVSLPAALARLDPAIDPAPDGTRVQGNLIAGNGRNPDPRLAVLGLGAADVVWDGTGRANCFALARTVSTFPPSLPAC